MIKTVITVCDFCYINGGAAEIALIGAKELCGRVDESIFFSAVGIPEDKYKDSDIQYISLEQKDILNNKNRYEAIIQGIWNCKAEKKIRELLSKKNPQNTIIHVHSWTKALSASIFKVTNEMGFKVVVTLHEYFTVCPNGGFYNYNTCKICNLAPMSTKCIFCNCDSRSYLHKIWRVLRQIVQNKYIIKNKNINYIYISDLSKDILKPIINNDKMYGLSDPVEIENRVKISPENNSIYLFIGRIAEEKGIRLFCDAVSNLNLKGVVIGDGYLLDELREKYENIHFTGWLNKHDIRKYMLKTRCLVFPSLWYETLGLTILEASAFGIPTIVSDCCVGKKFTSDELLFETGNINDLTKKLKLLLDDNDFVKKAGEKAYNIFDEYAQSVETYTKQLLKIYNTILNF